MASTKGKTTIRVLPADAATRALGDFLRTRRLCNRLPTVGGDPVAATTARRDYDRAVDAMRHAPISTPRDARAIMSYLLIELESVEPGPWCAPLFHNMMRYLRSLDSGDGNVGDRGAVETTRPAPHLHDFRPCTPCCVLRPSRDRARRRRR